MIDPDRFDDATLCDLALRTGEAEKSRDAEFFQALLAETLTFRRAQRRQIYFPFADETEIARKWNASLYEVQGESSSFSDTE